MVPRSALRGGLRLLLGGALVCSEHATAQVMASQFTQPFADCLSRIARDPNAEIEKLTSIEDSKLSNLEVSQKAYCLGEAHLALVYPTKALAAVEHGLKNLARLEYPWLYHRLMLLQAETYDAAGDPLKGLSSVNAALSWAQFSKDRGLEIDALRTSGLIKITLLDYIGALQALNQAYELAESEGSLAEKITIASSIALVYEYRLEYELAIPYFQQATEYYRAQGMDNQLSIALYGLGNANNHLGNLELGRSQMQESYDLAVKIDDQQGVGYALKELAFNDIQEKNYTDAEEKLLKAITIAELSDNPFLKINARRPLIDVYLALDKLDKVETLLNESEVLLKNESMRWQTLAIAQKRTQLMAARGNYQQAYESLLGIVDQREILKGQESAEQLFQVRAQYELESKEKENQILLREKQIAEKNLSLEQSRNTLLLIVLSMIGIISFLMLHNLYRGRETRQKLQQLANEDSLTGVFNRRRVLELIENQIKLAERHRFSFTLAVIDIDHFKQINDTFGHPVGDRVLKTFADIAISSLRSTDIIGRIGGEEFIIAFPHTGLESAEAVLEQLQLKVAEVGDLVDENDINVEFSAGLCELQPGMTITAIMAQADRALYRAKHSGRNKIVVVAEGTAAKAAAGV